VPDIEPQESLDLLGLAMPSASPPVTPTPAAGSEPVAEPDPEPPLVADAPVDAPVLPAEEGPVVDEGTNDPTMETALFDTVPDPTVISRSLIDEYHVPPFTIFDTRQGYWQDRKRLWLRLNIKSEIGRDEKLTYGKFNQSYEEKTREEWAGLSQEERAERGYELSRARALNPHTKQRYGGGSTSVFDPVLTEIMYRWLCPPGGAILDPFAGGSVRGIVAACLGHPYIGIELRGVQVEANREQAIDILRPAAVPVPTPMWVQGDSNVVLASGDAAGSDFVFTCPPYGDLEVYSDDPADLSNMKADDFDRTYHEIIVKAMGCLNDNRFAAVVVGNIRDKATGRIRDLATLTTAAMEEAGASLYNDAILLNVSGTGALRARKQFDVSRKLVRVHQTVLVYAKGDPRIAATDIGPIAGTPGD
jgi:hypothetical protein